MISFLQDLYMISEGDERDALPEDVMQEIQKNIRNGAKDVDQLWANALELVHKAYEVAGIQRPTPDMKSAWKQYEENLQYAVVQLSKFRGMEGNWRMSSAVFHEALQKMIRFNVTITSPQYSTSYVTEARSLAEVIEYIKKQDQEGFEIEVNKKDDGGAYLRFFRYGIRIKYRVDIDPIGVVGANI
jgi:hypothetical protein